MHLYLIRHGQSYVNLEEWAHGNTDEGLTDLGKRQAAALADWLPSLVPDVDVLYGSTLRRTRETIAPLAATYQLDVRFDDHLREMGCNRLDHTPFPNDDLPPEYASYWASERPFASITPCVDGGETWMHFRTRVGIFIEGLVERHPDEVVLVVAHGGVIEAAFDHIFNIGPWRHCEMWVRNTAVTHFQHVKNPGREPWRLHFHNRVEHLVGVVQE